MYLVVVKVGLSESFAFWKKHFDAHHEGRLAAGIEDVFCHPVIGEQAALYAVRTAHPRRIHDIVYDRTVRPGVEASGFVIGTEQLFICDLDVDADPVD